MNQQIENALKDLCKSLTNRGVMRDLSYEIIGRLIHESIAEDNANNNKQNNENEIDNMLDVLLRMYFRNQMQTYPSLNIGAVHCKLFRRFLLLKNQI